MSGKKLKQIRFGYTPTETQGYFTTDDGLIYTLERPWKKGPFPGGLSFESCVPDGTYKLVPHTRPDGTETVALVNPDLGVWYRKEDRPQDWGRYLVLIHSANFVEQVVGCIAPGLARTIYENKVMVTNSRVAMNRLNVRQYSTLEIASFAGAKDD